MSNEFTGEFFGTMILIVLGNGVVAGVVLNRTKAQNAGWMVITAAWAFAVLSGVFVAKAIGSPGYINPVGPLVGVVNGKLEAGPALELVLAELLGAFVGAALVWLHYLPHWAETPDADAKRAAFCTSPAIRSPGANLLSEAIGTFVLVFVGTAITEKIAGVGFVAPLGAALVWGIGLSLGATTGYAINPARDLGPRIAHQLLPIAGKGHSDWGYAWVPIVGPCLGAVAAALLAKQVMTG
ncbi:MAG TPA: MIP/aquaporin family protein [Gemmataceae bacterium]|nr:MIP/aquaporin family protein [Gemmataceae bacterium]